MSLIALALGGVTFGAISPVTAKVHRVSDDEAFFVATRSVKPGDVIELMGGKTYEAEVYIKLPGTAEAPITLRGISVGGKRPVIAGGEYGIEIANPHWVIENIEFTGAAYKCIFIATDDVVLRDLIVHDCKNGLLSADDAAGNHTVERCEFYRNGEGDYHHQLYTTTDQDKYPGAVFRLIDSYIHDGTGGNNVKSRAERNEIYFNWIEGARYHELELIGPDVDNPGPAREDSDVVGNVLRKTRGDSHLLRIGGDGTMDTNGRYRFAHNTILLKEEHVAPVRLFDGVESVELHNNVFFREGGGPIVLMRTVRATWTRGKPLIAGANNYLPTGSTEVPSQLVGTIEGTDPGFVDLAGLDLRPAEGSPLVDAAAPSPAGVADAPFPRPRTTLERQPQRTRVAQARPERGARDIGAFEAGSPAPASTGPVTSPPGAPPVPPPPGEPKFSADGEPAEAPPSDLPGVRRCGCATVEVASVGRAADPYGAGRWAGRWGGFGGGLSLVLGAWSRRRRRRTTPS
ncbi:MAG: hypothetical protein AAF928_05115 [Myxococcota bacterium]